MSALPRRLTSEHAPQESWCATKGAIQLTICCALLLVVMLPFLELARERKVRRVVLHSSSPTPAGGPGIGVVHEAIPEMFGEWAVLRPTWFMQNFSGDRPYAQMIRQTGAIVTGTGEAPVVFTDAADVAGGGSVRRRSSQHSSSPHRTADATDPKRWPPDPGEATVYLIVRPQPP